MAVVITKEELETRYKSSTAVQLAKDLGVCIGTLYDVLEKAGIPRKGHKNRKGNEPKIKVI